MCVYYRRPTICCLSRSQSPHFFLNYNLSHSTIYHQIFNMIYRAGVTSRAGTVYPSETSKCTLVFGGILDIQSFVFCVVLCGPLLSLLSIFYWPLVLSVPPSYDFWLHFVDRCCTYCLFSIDHCYCLYLRLTTSDYTLSTIVVLIVYFLLTIGYQKS
jgi:hypothetical protein